ncbi:Hypothetical predicted protein [Cloeon dipterum]|uniref:E3 ubiquitin-protein ligase MSL2 n=1 Tax=Cloeon dipterum TaxID=197152 RepID=A0A8S1D3D8_9INSE|nr:Hypothetical predicted protein [Cloeon dipterum]
MNSTSLYVSTCRVVLQADSEDPSSWGDLYRLVPYLRQSLSCTVCGNLLIEPFTPTDTNCQHHVCKGCQGGKKKLKPSCGWCKNYEKYVENVQLRILLQCYKKLCEYITSTSIYRKIASAIPTNGGSLVDLINEGAGFKDDYKSTAGLSKSAYSILPCVYTSSSTQTSGAIATTPSATAAVSTAAATKVDTPPPIKTVSNGQSLYSVMYASGNKITIKRKASGEQILQTAPAAATTVLQPATTAAATVAQTPMTVATAPVEVTENEFKKPKQVSVVKSPKPKTKKKGCRCGNATATPGKLTCCGQRCPCYVEAKACVECRCRGCRNPHRPGGKKVRPHIPELHSIQIHLPTQTTGQTTAGAAVSVAQQLTATTHHLHNTSGGMMITASPSRQLHQIVATSVGHTSTILEAKNLQGQQILGVHPQLVYAPSSTLNLQNVSSVLPAALLVGDEKSPSNSDSETEDSDVDVDV